MVEGKREPVRERRAPRRVGVCDVWNNPAPRKGRELIILAKGGSCGAGSLVEAAAEALAIVRAEYTEKFIKLGAYCSERVEWHPLGWGVIVTFTPVTGCLR